TTNCQYVKQAANNYNNNNDAPSDAITSGNKRFSMSSLSSSNTASSFCNNNNNNSNNKKKKKKRKSFLSFSIGHSNFNSIGSNSSSIAGDAIDTGTLDPFTASNNYSGNDNQFETKHQRQSSLLSSVAAAATTNTTTSQAKASSNSNRPMLLSGHSVPLPSHVHAHKSPYALSQNKYSSNNKKPSQNVGAAKKHSTSMSISLPSTSSSTSETQEQLESSGSSTDDSLRGAANRIPNNVAVGSSRLSTVRHDTIASSTSWEQQRAAAQHVHHDNLHALPTTAYRSQQQQQHQRHHQIPQQRQSMSSSLATDEPTDSTHPHTQRTPSLTSSSTQFAKLASRQQQMQSRASNSNNANAHNNRTSEHDESSIYHEPSDSISEHTARMIKDIDTTTTTTTNTSTTATTDDSNSSRHLCKANTNNIDIDIDNNNNNKRSGNNNHNPSDRDQIHNRVRNNDVLSTVPLNNNNNDNGRRESQSSTASLSASAGGDDDSPKMGLVTGIFFKVWSLVKVAKLRRNRHRASQDAASNFEYMSGDQIAGCTHQSAPIRLSTNQTDKDQGQFTTRTTNQMNRKLSLPQEGPFLHQQAHKSASSDNRYHNSRTFRSHQHRQHQQQQSQHPRISSSATETNILGLAELHYDNGPTMAGEHSHNNDVYTVPVSSSSTTNNHASRDIHERDTNNNNAQQEQQHKQHFAIRDNLRYPIVKSFSTNNFNQPQRVKLIQHHPRYSSQLRDSLSKSSITPDDQQQQQHHDDNNHSNTCGYDGRLSVRSGVHCHPRSALLSDADLLSSNCSSSRDHDSIQENEAVGDQSSTVMLSFQRPIASRPSSLLLQPSINNRRRRFHPNEHSFPNDNINCELIATSPMANAARSANTAHMAMPYQHYQKDDPLRFDAFNVKQATQHQTIAPLTPMSPYRPTANMMLAHQRSHSPFMSHAHVNCQQVTTPLVECLPTTNLDCFGQQQQQVSMQMKRSGYSAMAPPSNTRRLTGSQSMNFASYNNVPHTHQFVAPNQAPHPNLQSNSNNNLKSDCSHPIFANVNRQQHALVFQHANDDWPNPTATMVNGVTTTTTAKSNIHSTSNSNIDSASFPMLNMDAPHNNMNRLTMNCDDDLINNRKFLDDLGENFILTDGDGSIVSNWASQSEVNDAFRVTIDCYRPVLFHVRTLPSMPPTGAGRCADSAVAGVVTYDDCADSANNTNTILGAIQRPRFSRRLYRAIKSLVKADNERLLLSAPTDNHLSNSASSYDAESTSANHILVEGSTGSGKTSFVNRIVELNQRISESINVVNANVKSIDLRPTVISTHSIVECVLANQLVAYHYCQAHDYATRNPIDFIHNLVHQLLQSKYMIAYQQLLMYDHHLASTREENRPKSQIPTSLRDILSRSSCLRDPLKALQLGVLEPLKMLWSKGLIGMPRNHDGTKDLPMLIFIDSLDEACKNAACLNHPQPSDEIAATKNADISSGNIPSDNQSSLYTADSQCHPCTSSKLTKHPRFLFCDNPIADLVHRAAFPPWIKIIATFNIDHNCMGLSSRVSTNANSQQKESNTQSRPTANNTAVWTPITIHCSNNAQDVTSDSDLMEYIQHRTKDWSPYVFENLNSSSKINQQNNASQKATGDNDISMQPRKRAIHSLIKFLLENSRGSFLYCDLVMNMIESKKITFQKRNSNTDINSSDNNNDIVLRVDKQFMQSFNSSSINYCFKRGEDSSEVPTSLDRILYLHMENRYPFHATKCFGNQALAIIQILAAMTCSCISVTLDQMSLFLALSAGGALSTSHGGQSNGSNNESEDIFDATNKKRGRRSSYFGTSQDTVRRWKLFETTMNELSYANIIKLQQACGSALNESSVAVASEESQRSSDDIISDDRLDEPWIDQILGTASNSISSKSNTSRSAFVSFTFMFKHDYIRHWLSSSPQAIQLRTTNRRRSSATSPISHFTHRFQVDTTFGHYCLAKWLLLPSHKVSTDGEERCVELGQKQALACAYQHPVDKIFHDIKPSGGDKYIELLDDEIRSFLEDLDPSLLASLIRKRRHMYASPAGSTIRPLSPIECLQIASHAVHCFASSCRRRRSSSSLSANGANQLVGTAKDQSSLGVSTIQQESGDQLTVDTADQPRKRSLQFNSQVSETLASPWFDELLGILCEQDERLLTEALTLPINIHDPQIEASRLLLSAGANPNALIAPNVGRGSPTIKKLCHQPAVKPLILVMTEENNLEFVKLLLQFQANPNIVASSVPFESSTSATKGVAFSPLIVAAYRGYYEIFKLLIEHGANLLPTVTVSGSDSPDRIKPQRYDPLIISMCRGHTDIVGYILSRLLSTCFDSDVVNPPSTQTIEEMQSTCRDVIHQALVVACLRGQLDMVTILLNDSKKMHRSGQELDKAFLDRIDNQLTGHTPLTAAASSVHFYELCTILRQHGADTRATNDFDRTALMCLLSHLSAPTRNSRALNGFNNDQVLVIIRLLGSDIESEPSSQNKRRVVDYQDKQGLSAVMLASRLHDDNVKKGLDRQLSVDSSDDSSEGINGHGQKLDTLSLRVLACLLNDLGAMVNLVDTSGSHALIHAVCANNVKAANFLLSNGADINLVNNSGKAAIDFACNNDSRYQMVKLLINSGAEFERKDTLGLRLLDRVIEHYSDKSPKIIDLLLANGAKIGSKTWAVAHNNWRVLMVLLNKLCQDAYYLYKKGQLDASIYRFEYAIKRIAIIELEDQRCQQFRLVRPDSVQDNIYGKRGNGHADNNLMPIEFIKSSKQIKAQMFLGLSRCASKQKNHNKALEYAHMAILIDPSSYEGYYSKAQILKEIRDYRGALASSEQALKLIENSLFYSKIEESEEVFMTSPNRRSYLLQALKYVRRLNEDLLKANNDRSE
ncbi:Protein TANC2, partial [Fragariocoptes setiger]